MSVDSVEIFKCPATGITVIHERMPEARTVSCGLYVRSGAANESAKESGMSHFLEHLVFKGEVQNGAELTQLIADLGSHVNAYTTDEHTSYYAVCLPEVASHTLALLLEVLRPKFSVADVSLEREVILEEMRQYKDDPGYVVHEKGLQFLAPRNPLTRPIIGTESALKRAKKSEIEDFFYRRYDPSRIALSIVGDTSGVDILGVLESHAKRCAPRTPNPAAGQRDVVASSLKIRRGIQRLTKREISLSHITAFWPAVSEHSAEKFALELWSDIIGAGSRFAWKLIEPGLVESAGLSCEPRFHTGYMMLTACCESRDLALVEAEVENILNEAITRPIDNDELEQAKAMTEFALSTGFETPAGRMTAHGEHWLSHGEPYHLHSELNEFRSVTLAQVNQFAARFQWKDAAITSLSPAG